MLGIPLGWLLKVIYQMVDNYNFYVRNKVYIIPAVTQTAKNHGADHDYKTKT